MAIADTHLRIFGLPDLGQDPGVIVTASPSVVSGSAASNVLDQTSGSAAIWLDTGTDSYVEMQWTSAPTGGFNAILVAFAKFKGGVDLTTLRPRLKAEWDDDGLFTGVTAWPTGGGWQDWIIEGSGSTDRKQWESYDGAIPTAELDRLNAQGLLHTFIEAPSFPTAVTAKPYLRVHFSTAEVSPPATSERHIGWVCPCYAYYSDPHDAESSSHAMELRGGIADSETRGGVKVGGYRTTSRGIELFLQQVHEVDARMGFMGTFERNPQARLGILFQPDKSWKFHRGGFGVYTFAGSPRIENPIKKAAGHLVYDVRLSLETTR